MENTKDYTFLTVAPTPKEYDILLVTPCRGNPVWQHVQQSTIAACVPRIGMSCTHMVVHGDGIFRMRTMLLNHFRIRADFKRFSHVVFIDSDIIFQADDVFKLATCGSELCGGLYPKRQDGQPDYVVNLCESNPVINGQTGLQRVAKLGTGVMCISRECVEKICAHFHPNQQVRMQSMRQANEMRAAQGLRGIDRMWYELPWWYLPDDGARQWWFDFFPMVTLPDPDSGFIRQLSEDWIFSVLASCAGVIPMLHTDVITKHQGTKIYG